MFIFKFLKMIPFRFKYRTIILDFSKQITGDAYRRNCVALKDASDDAHFGRTRPLLVKTPAYIPTYTYTYPTLHARLVS